MDTESPINSLTEPIPQGGGLDATALLQTGSNGSPDIQQDAGEVGVEEALALSAKVAPAPLDAASFDDDTSDTENTPSLTSATRTEDSWADNDTNTPFEEAHIVSDQGLVYDDDVLSEEDSENEQIASVKVWRRRGKGEKLTSGAKNKKVPPPKPVPKSTASTAAASTSTAAPANTVTASLNAQGSTSQAGASRNKAGGQAAWR